MSQTKIGVPGVPSMNQSRPPSPDPPAALPVLESSAEINPQDKFVEFLLDLFRLNSYEEACNIECENSIRKCPLKSNYGPHNAIQLNFITCSLFELLFRHNFKVLRSLDSRRPRLRCAYVLKCPDCGVELFDTSSLLVTVYDRWEIVCKLMQQVYEARPSHGTMQAQNTLVNQLKYQHPTSLLYYRRHVERVLRDSHRTGCTQPRLNITQNLTTLEMLSRFNRVLSDLCATCFFQQVELDLRIYISVYNARYSEETTTASCSIDILCRCCFRNRAQVNVPCGHVFQCELCKIKLRESLMQRLGCVVNEPPCSICRAYVITTINVYD